MGVKWCLVSCAAYMCCTLPLRVQPGFEWSLWLATVTLALLMLSVSTLTLKSTVVASLSALSTV